MIHHAALQGSPEWHRLRMGRPTASRFERIITPAKGEPTKGETRRKYTMELLTELILDMPLDTATTAAMQSGHDWEPRARAAYEMLHGVDVELCGFVTDDVGAYGASPDGFVGDEGSIEIKSPFNPEIHVGYLVAPETLKQEYFVQTQGQLYVTGRKWTDLVSYFGGMPMVCVRVTPVEEFQAKLAAALKTFCGDLALYVEMAKDRGWIKPQAETNPRDHSADFVTEADLEMLYGARPGGKE